jgi:hypothetical protein
MYRKAEPLYGAPRGNRVMAAKRTVGPSAKRILDTHVILERCSVAGCFNRVLVTRNHTGVLKVRQCAEHVAGKAPVQTRSVSDLLSLDNYHTGIVR